MTETTGDLSRYDPPRGGLDYPTNAVVGIVPVEHIYVLIDAIKSEGVAEEAIMVVTHDRRDDFMPRLMGGGVRGAIARFISSTGGDLDYAKALAMDLQAGRVYLEVNVGRSQDLRTRIGDALRQHRAVHVAYLTRGSIETLDGEILG